MKMNKDIIINIINLLLFIAIIILLINKINFIENFVCGGYCNIDEECSMNYKCIKNKCCI